MESILAGVASIGAIIIIIAILIAIAPYLYMFFMYKQIKKLQKKMDDVVKYTNYIARCEYDKKVRVEGKNENNINKNSPLG